MTDHYFTIHKSGDLPSAKIVRIFER